ncbi:hypothetical protein EMPG_13905 [Blastomyces silverae]|uniref:Uncharacterized protein n=1 Tax=Blastomyces silverae TaxID=2060906 RepID=A0A0H1BH92_9EURO|nr:hypothetical protein EMPG_13905 [Blastomyces silverae]
MGNKILPLRNPSHESNITLYALGWEYSVRKPSSDAIFLRRDAKDSQPIIGQPTERTIYATKGLIIDIGSIRSSPTFEIT